MTEGRAQFGLVAAVLAIGTAAPLFRSAEGASPLVVAGGRLLLAAVIYALALRRIDRRTFLAGAAAGVLYAVHFGTWALSLEHLSVAASVSMVTITPLFLALHGALTGKDRPTRHHIVAMVIAFIGVAIVADAEGTGASPWKGTLLALAGAVAMAAYLLRARREGPELDALAFSFAATATGGTLLLGASAGLGVLTVPSARDGLVMAALAFGPQLIGHYLLTTSLKRLPPIAVGIATLGEPAVAALLAWAFLEEVPALQTLVGCVGVALGVGVLLVQRARTPEP